MAGPAPHGHGGQGAREAQKRAAGVAAAAEVRDGMVVGLGTGSTARHAVLEIARRMRHEGLQVLGIPTSLATQALAQAEGIPLTDLDAHPVVDLTIDGADECDGRLRLIKGGGGALTREKIVWAASKRCVAVVDASKIVATLGSTFALPVEVIPLARTPVRRRLEALGATVVQRTAGEAPLRTDNGNWILDARWPAIAEPEALDMQLSAAPGIVATGLFLGLCDAAIVAGPDGLRTLAARRDDPHRTTARRG